MKAEIKIIEPRIDALEYATAGAAAVDLRACAIIDGDNRVDLEANEVFTLLPGARVKIGTGIAIHVGSLEDNGVPVCGPSISAASLLLPRSGAGWRGFELANTVGLIDADYTGELILAAKNGGNEPITFSALERLAQMMIVPVLRPEYVTVAEFSSSTARGNGAFGSTGIK